VQGVPRLSLSQRFALLELAGVVELSQREMAERLDLEKSTVSRLVYHLLELGLVVRHTNRADRRNYRLGLTEAGRMAAQRVADGYRRLHQKLVVGMSEEEAFALMTGLSALMRSIDSITADGS
jgi:DNA-binding MarR family transcriptional regulator